MKKPRIQIIEINIPQAYAVVTIDDKSKTEHDEITGLFLYSSYDASNTGSTLELKINSEEVFPKGFDADLITVNFFSTYKKALYPLTMPAKGGKIEGVYTDSGKAMTYPNKVKLYFITVKNE